MALVAAAAAVWLGQAPFGPPLERPWWALDRDLYLDGPDAGHWAEQLALFRDGVGHRLDPHRAPTWTLWSALFLPLTGNVALAGHLSNHLLLLALGPLCYGLGLGLHMGRVGAAAFAVATLLHVETRRSAASFAVDLCVNSAWVACFASAVWVEGRVRRALLAGLAGALCFAAHFTTMPAPLAAAAVVLLGAPRGRRLGPVAAYLASATATLVLIYQLLPPIDLKNFWDALYIGIVNQETRHEGASIGVRIAAVLDRARWTALPALDQWYATQVPGGLLPAALLSLLGALGMGLLPRGDLSPLAGILPRPLRVVGDFALRGAGAGLPMLAMLAALPLFFVVAASPRYAWLLEPVVLALLIRGAVSLGALADGLIGRSLLRPLLPVGAALVVLQAQPWQRGDELAYVLRSREAGVAIRDHFGPVPVVAWQREIALYTDQPSCPDRPCPEVISGLEACLRQIRAQCAGDGDIPYVVVDSELVFGRTDAGKAMDAWMLQTWPTVVDLGDSSFRVRVVAIPRERVSHQ